MILKIDEKLQLFYYIVIFMFIFMNISHSKNILDINKNNKTEGKTYLFKKNEEEINRINNFFLNLKTIKANFKQYINNDTKNYVVNGVFYISRPGKLRFEYQKPFKSLLINNNNTVYYYDIDLDELTTIPSKETPLNFLLKNNKSLSDLNFEIINIKKEGKKMFIETINKDLKNIDTKNITFIFNEDLSMLMGVVTQDESENELRLDFDNIELNQEFNKNLFIFNKNKKLKN